MNSIAKISLYWLLIAFGLVLQASIELMQRVYFTVNTQGSSVNEIPIIVQVMFLVTMIIPVIFSFLNSIIHHKIFTWISIVYATLLLVVNGYHFVGDGFNDPFNISKTIVLLLIPIMNFFLIIELIQLLRKKKAS